MNDLENALRDALGARATAVRPDVTAYERMVARRSRRPLTRRTAVGAAAAVALSVTAMVVFAPAGGAPPAEPVSPVRTVAPAPTTLASVTARKLFVYDGFHFDEFRTTHPEGYAVTAVTAAGAGRYYSAAVSGLRGGRCRSLLNRLDVEIRSNGSRTTHDEVAEVKGWVRNVAVSRDGQRLAYFIRLADPETGHCGLRGEVRVRDLRTGEERAWQAAEPSQYPAEVSSLSWAPDNLHLALGTGFEVLDTAAPETTYRVDRWDQVVVGDRYCAVLARTYRWSTGDQVVWLRCSQPEDWGRNGVYEVGADGRAARQLFAAPVDLVDTPTPALTFDASGDHLLVTVRDGGIVRVFRWDERDGLREADSRPGSATTEVVW